MRRFSLTLAVLLTLLSCAKPGHAQDLDQATLSKCIQGMETVTTGNTQLQTLPQFFKDHARRAKVVDGDIFAVETGTKGADFWVIVLPSATSDQSPQPATFQFDPAQDLFYITAAPMTKAWMGLGCLHETVHAKDILEGQEPRNASRASFLAGEVRAFQTELVAVDHFTQNAFSNTLKEILSQQQFDRSEQILIPNDAARASLDQVFPQPAVASAQERAVRDGFYVIALNFAQLPTEAERLEFLEKLY